MERSLSSNRAQQVPAHKVNERKLMRRFRVTAFFTVISILSGCQTNQMTGDLPDKEAGYLVIGLAAYDTMESRAIQYTLDYRYIGSNDTGFVRFTPKKELELMPFLTTKTDFEDHEEMGVIEVRKLAPGHYELFAIEGALFGGIVQWRWSRTGFSIPFTIEAGKATYFGHFQGHSTSVHSVLSLGAPFPSGAYFVVSNQQDHDLQIARKKVGAFQDMIIGVPDVAELRSEYFLEKCPSTGCN